MVNKMQHPLAGVDKSPRPYTAEGEAIKEPLDLLGKQVFFFAVLGG